MSKFKAYLINEYQEIDKSKPRGKHLNYRQTMDIIRKNCKKTWQMYLDETSFISRITSSGRDDFSFMDSRKDADRMSKNTENYYTHIINKDPIWKGYPRRQIIATSGFFIPTVRKNVYIVVPYDKTPIGVCKSTDIWLSFSKILGMSASFFNSFIESLLEKPDNKWGSYDGSLKEFKDRCKVFDDWYNGKHLETQLEKNIHKAASRISALHLQSRDYGWFLDDEYKKAGDNLYIAVRNVYSPDGFQLIKSGMAYLPNKQNEVWFDGPAVIIDSLVAEEIKNDLY